MEVGTRVQANYKKVAIRNHKLDRNHIRVKQKGTNAVNETDNAWRNEANSRVYLKSQRKQHISKEIILAN